MTDRELLARIAQRLREWAYESKAGHWSTHQVKDQLALASAIEAHLYRSGAEAGIDAFIRGVKDGTGEQP